MPKAKKVEHSNLHLNVVAMLDVVFNLIFFFICITNLSSGELPPLTVPTPEKSKAILIPERKKIILNIIPVDGGEQAKAVKVGSDTVGPGEEARITKLLKDEVALDPNIEIDLRADKSIHFQYIRPVMTAITRAGISKINLVAGGENAE